MESMFKTISDIGLVPVIKIEDAKKRQAKLDEQKPQLLTEIANLQTKLEYKIKENIPVDD